MVGAQYETFLVSGLLVLIGALLFVAWSVWRLVERGREIEMASFAGVGYELHRNLVGFLGELSQLATGDKPIYPALLPLSHPQLDALQSKPNATDRKALSRLQGTYDAMAMHKQALTVLLGERQPTEGVERAAAETLIRGLAELYLWQAHAAKPAHLARATRSWHVRDWMKTNGFADAHILPSVHLRDAVVQHLRDAGMSLSPKPLDHTASEYFAKRYDRKADPNAPFWRRRLPATTETSQPEPESAGSDSEVSVEPTQPPQTAPPVTVEPEPTAEPTPSPEVERTETS